MTGKGELKGGLGQLVLLLLGVLLQQDQLVPQGGDFAVGHPGLLLHRLQLHRLVEQIFHRDVIVAFNVLDLLANLLKGKMRTLCYEKFDLSNQPQLLLILLSLNFVRLLHSLKRLDPRLGSRRLSRELLHLLLDRVHG